MKLRDVLSGCGYEAAPGLEIEITGIAYDSRKVSRGTLFVAVKGGHVDGRDFIDDAVQSGAAAVVLERAVTGDGFRVTDTKQDAQVFIRVRDGREALACIANNFYSRPSENISVVGVTGTNGKTTTSYLVKSILEAWQKKTGLIGTIQYLIGGAAYPALHTTPEAVEFQGLLREMASEGCSHVVTEVSSHALAQKRVDHTRFTVAVFTNLTRDHLDYHGTMEDYFAAKERLFTLLLSKAGTAVINADDEWGRRLLKAMAVRDNGRGKRRVITYGTENEADVSASEIVNSPSGISFVLTYKGQRHRIASALVGTPNLSNALAAASAGVALNVPMETIREGLSNVGLVRGRLEKVDAGQDFLCVIDYAHTPDALERLLLTAGGLLRNKDRPGRIITLFGCGGDRDRGKRPVMGEIATRLSDFVIITSDNPRSENPGEIIKEIVSGIARDNYTPVPDRGDAIHLAVEKAGAGDILLIAGKGHEEYQEIKGIRHRFSDGEAVEEAIRNKLSEKSAKR